MQCDVLIKICSRKFIQYLYTIIFLKFPSSLFLKIYHCIYLRYLLSIQKLGKLLIFTLNLTVMYKYNRFLSTTDT